MEIPPPPDVALPPPPDIPPPPPLSEREQIGAAAELLEMHEGTELYETLVDAVALAEAGVPNKMFRVCIDLAHQIVQSQQHNEGLQAIIEQMRTESQKRFEAQKGNLAKMLEKIQKQKERNEELAKENEQLRLEQVDGQPAGKVRSRRSLQPTLQGRAKNNHWLALPPIVTSFWGTHRPPI